MLDGERRRLRPAIDAIAAVLYGVEADDLAHVLHETDLPVAAIRRKSHELNVCGFWRVDRDKDPELRHTVLTLIAFHDFEAKIEAAGGDREQGIEDFFAQNDGEGWLLPETLRLADYGLGHDERADHPQSVVSRLGPRFYGWQLARSADESGRECHLHARNLLGAHDYALLLAEVIERRADSDDSLDRLTDPFTRDLTGEDGYLTLLLEIRARNALDEAAWWTTVDALQTPVAIWQRTATAHSSTSFTPADTPTTSATAGGGGVILPRRATSPFHGRLDPVWTTIRRIPQGSDRPTCSSRRIQG